MKDDDKKTLTNELIGLRQRIAELESIESQCRLAKESLREAEAKYRSIFENAVEGMFQATIDGRYLAANPALANMMGYETPEELMSEVTDVRQLYIDQSHREDLINFLKTEGEVTGLEVPVRRKDGSEIWISVNVRALLDSSGITVGFEGTVLNITELKNVQEKLQEAEIRYHALFYRSPDGVLIIDPQTMIALEFNQAAHRQLGYTRDEFKRIRIFEYETIKNLDEMRSHIEKVLNKGRDDFETQHRTKKGELRNVLVTVQPIELSGRLFLFCIFRDITEIRKAEEALRESEQRYRTIIEYSNDMIWTLDTKGNFLFFNKRSEEISGYRLEDWKGKSFAPLVKENELPGVIEVFKKTMSGQTQQYEVTIRRKDGNDLVLSVNTTPIFSKGEVVGTVSFGRDITERKRAEELLHNYTVKLEESNRLKDLFTDIMRHDLLNPLGIIRTAAEQMLVAEKKEGTKDERMSNTLYMIERNANKLIEMIKSASMYALLESAEKLDRKSLDLNEIFRDVVNNFIPLLEEKSMTLQFISKGGCCVMANPMIDTVFSNLISNAIKYSPPGKKIEVKIIEEKDNFKIYVKDWGYGIKDEDKLKIFTRFHRVDKMGVKGTGLGLAIVKRIVDLHGGKVWIEDNPEGGSVFCVEIPKDFGI